MVDLLKEGADVIRKSYISDLITDLKGYIGYEDLTIPEDCDEDFKKQSKENHKEVLDTLFENFHSKEDAKLICKEIIEAINMWGYDSVSFSAFSRIMKWEKTITKGVDETTESPDFITIKYNDSGKEISRKVNIDEVADYIIDKFDIKTIFGLKEESVYIYEDGIWMPTGKGLIKNEIENLLKTYAKNNVVLEILEKIKRKTEFPRTEFDIVLERKACVENGVLDLRDVDNITFLPHDKKYFFKSKLPVIYDSEAKCPVIIDFIEETFYPCDLPQVQEWIGLHLDPIYSFKKAVICEGKHDTGKSVFLNLMSNFLGHDNVSGLSLQKISAGKSFDILSLKGAYANIFDDLSSKDLTDGGGFKMTVGDGMITGELKFGDMMRFRNSAKMTYACNKIPPIKDIDDDAYYSRWLIWSFDNVVEGSSKNSNLINLLTTQEQLSGLLNWAIVGFQRLINQNNFSNAKDVMQIKALMTESGNPLAEFANDALIKEPGSKITKDMMYNMYCEFCMKHEPVLSPCSKTQLGKRLNRVAPYLMASHSGSIRHWLNVKPTPLWYTWYTSLKNYRDILGSNKGGSKEGKNDVYKITGTVPNVPVYEQIQNGDSEIIDIDEKNKKKEKVFENEKKVESKSDDSLKVSEKDVFFHIKRLGKGEMNTEELIEHFGIDAEKLIDKLKRDGKLFEPKAGRVKIL